MKIFRVCITIVVSLAAAALIAAIAAAGTALYLLSPVSHSADDAPVRFEVAEGTSVRAAAARLAELGLIRNADVFSLYARYRNLVIKTGIYEIPPLLGVPEICALLESGKQEYITFVVPEGLTLSKIARRLEDAGVMTGAQFIAAAHDAAMLAEYGIPADSFEGFLFPDTYFLEPDMQPERVVRMMADTFFARIADIEQADGMSAAELYDTVILASIVEREYRIADEAPLIASVFKNRLREHIGLYSCATVEYIITEIHGLPHPDVITYDDLEDDNPYNTYKWAGLPPGPISNPGLIALKAAFDTPETDYYFFRLIDETNGAHYFSESFDEHTEAGRVLHTKKAAGS